MRVEIPFGKRSILGYVVERSEQTEFAEVRAIDRVIDEPRLILDHHLALARQIADRYCAPLGEVLERAFRWCAGWEQELKRLFGAYVDAKQRQSLLD